ncbi:ParB/RepB/Spo0J family partition protein [Candidatus Hydrogenedentota bacterium]
MESKTGKRALGRGLQALLADSLTEQVRQDKPSQGMNKVSLERISPNRYQPRVDFDAEALNELADSIRANGLLQPIVVREIDGAYELIAGERRFRACKQAGLAEIPVYVRNVSDSEMLVLALVENIQREDLDPLEEAGAYRRLMKEFSLTQDQLATQIGKDRSTIANSVRLLLLPPEIQRYLSNGMLSTGHARALLGLKDPALMTTICKQVISRKLSVRQVEKVVKKQARHDSEAPGAEGKNGTGRGSVDPNILALEEELQRILGTKVKIYSKGDRGTIEIEYYSNEDFNRILDMLKE